MRLARNIVRVRDGKRRGDILTPDLSYHGTSMFTLGWGQSDPQPPVR
ncbi:hypothetical protein ACFSNO_09440 [Streptomyces cirratus]